MALSRTSEIIVAGFHRSGTSSATQLLHAGGLFVGDDLIGALPFNPYGHYEDRDVVRIHDEILRDNGLNWQVAELFVPRLDVSSWRAMERHIENRRSRHRLWGFKDPRVCLFLPLWKHLLPDAKVLIVFRSAKDCAYSLSRRHATELFTGNGPADVHRRFFDEQDLALRMWLTHNEALLAFAAQHPEDVLAIGFDSLQRGIPLTRLARTAWGAPLHEVPTLSALDPAATQQRDRRQALADATLAATLDSVWARLRTLERASLAMLGGSTILA